jgi:hypothetical protein
MPESSPQNTGESLAYRDLKSLKPGNTPGATQSHYCVYARHHNSSAKQAKPALHHPLANQASLAMRLIESLQSKS